MVETYRRFDGVIYKLKQCCSGKQEAKNIAKVHRDKKNENRARVVPSGRSFCVYIKPVVLFGKVVDTIFVR